ncbi:hypothetical protein [Desulfocurvus sp.]|uniref:hypothetical protein n=1 Tax=Desulfocurvus sp. TaxID=2871698 RepID=UPI0025C0AA3E|nr:hypothetical protein [Desulfocurvus sp.]MCK9239838.1 hypothetical protein [Desulfocurvus sp.]
MTEDRKKPTVPGTPGSAAQGRDVPELELEDVSWEIEGQGAPGAQADEAPAQAGEYDIPEVEAETLEAGEPEVDETPAPQPTRPQAASRLMRESYVDPEADYAADWGWRTKTSGFQAFVFSLHGRKMLVSPRGVEPIDEVGGIGRYFKYLTDYADSPGMGILTLNTEAKYAEVLARKQLEEAGELSSEGILHVFSKRKLEGGQISVFYEILPRDRFVGVSESYAGYPQGFVILDTVSLLYGLLKRHGRGAHVLALHIPGAIVMVAGKNGEVYLSRRYTLVGDDGDALVEGIFALEQDVAALEKNLGQRVSHINWIEGLTNTLNLPRPDVEIPLVPYPVHRLQHGGETVWSALPEAVQDAPMSAILGPREERLLRPLELAEKYVWAAMLAAALVAFVGYGYVASAKGEVMQRLAAMQSSNGALESQLQARSAQLTFEDVGSAMQTASELRTAALSPPLGEMWNYLSSLRPDYLRVDGLEFAYAPEGVSVRLEGQVEMDISTAQHGFVKFVSSLERQGFTIQSKQIDLGLEGNYYSLNALWPLKKKGD